MPLLCRKPTRRKRNKEEVRFDFEIGTRVQVMRDQVGWASWSGTIIGRHAKTSRTISYYYPEYLIRFHNCTAEYDDWYPQECIFI